MDFWTQYSNELARAVLPVDWPQSRTKQEYGNGDRQARRGATFVAVVWKAEVGRLENSDSPLPRPEDG